MYMTLCLRESAFPIRFFAVGSIALAILATVVLGSGRLFSPRQEPVRVSRQRSNLREIVEACRAEIALCRVNSSSAAPDCTYDVLLGEGVVWLLSDAASFTVSSARALRPVLQGSHRLPETERPRTAPSERQRHHYPSPAVEDQFDRDGKADEPQAGPGPVHPQQNAQDNRKDAVQNRPKFMWQVDPKDGTAE